MFTTSFNLHYKTMAYALEAQEQIASMKAFWTKYGNLLTWLLILSRGPSPGSLYSLPHPQPPLPLRGGLTLLPTNTHPLSGRGGGG